MTLAVGCVLFLFPQKSWSPHYVPSPPFREDGGTTSLSLRVLAFGLLFSVFEVLRKFSICSIPLSRDLILESAVISDVTDVEDEDLSTDVIGERGLSFWVGGDGSESVPDIRVVFTDTSSLKLKCTPSVNVILLSMLSSSSSSMFISHEMFLTASSSEIADFSDGVMILEVASSHSDVSVSLTDSGVKCLNSVFCSVPSTFW